jgi:DNA polymerase (family 10)
MTDNKLIKILKNIAILLEIKGENQFKFRAYSVVADTLEEEQIDVSEELANGTLSSIKGIGSALTSKITEYLETGTIKFYENLIAEIPESLVEITRISQIGPKRAKLIWDKLGITTIDALQKACENDTLSKLKGFSAKSQELVLNSIYHRKASKGLHLQSVAINEAEELLRILHTSGIVKRAEITGDYRRFSETVDLLEFVVEADSSDELIALLSTKYDLKLENEIIDFNTKSELPAKIYICNSDNYIKILHETTGNEHYLNSLDVYCQSLGSPSSTDDSEIISEENIYRNIGLQFIPPELRESGRAITAAKAGLIPELIQPSDLKGMLHVHTNWSDGKHTIEEMALSAKAMGFEYIAICDHSRTAAYAGGLTIERVHEQMKEIDRINDQIDGIKILKGIESDILPDGSLDYPDDILGLFDVVVASVHSNFNMKQSEMTRRIVYALMSPFTTILGHPTGRLLLARDAYEIDIREVIDAAAALGKVIEINANPYRLDLTWENVIYAKEKGMKVAINPDSHRHDTMKDIYIGVKAARKGWLTKKDVINCLSLDDFMTKIVKK